MTRPLTEHEPPGSPTDGTTWHRLSPKMLIVHPALVLVRLVPVLAALVLARGGNVASLITDLVLAGLVTLLAVSRWFTTQLRITAQQVELRQGLVRRRTTATRRDRIRTVDVTAHPLHRVLGLSRVVIGTGTSDRRREGLVLDGLPDTVAAELRDDLLHRVPSRPPVANIPDGMDLGVTTSFAADAGSAEPVHEIVRLDPRWVRFAPFTLSGVITGLVIWGFFWRLQGDGFDLTRSAPARALAADAGQASVLVVVLVAVAAVVVFVAVTSTIGYVLAFWGFRVVRHAGGTVQVTRGLVTTRATSIERRRLVGVELSSALPVRVVGGGRLLAVATGLRIGRGAERGGEILLPPAPRTIAERVAADVLDGVNGLTVPLEAHPASARRRRLVRVYAVTVLLAAAAVAGYLTGGTIWPVAVSGLLLVLAAPLALDRYANLGHAVVQGHLVSQFGSVVRRRTVLDGSAVIGWTIRRTVFQRRLGLATVTATTAAGRQGVRVVDLDLAQTMRLAEAVTPGLLDPFRQI